MTHTKGKWTLGNENNSCCEVVLGEEHNLVCTLDRQDANTSEVVISRDEMLANAHLIMAAPQLLEALKALRDYIRGENCDCHCEPGPDTDCPVVNADAAIKAAEGGE